MKIVVSVELGAGNQVGGRHPVEEFGLADPPPPPHEFFFHHRQMRRGPAKRNRAQLQKRQGELPQRRVPNFRGLSHCPCGAGALARVSQPKQNSRGYRKFRDFDGVVDCPYPLLKIFFS